MTNELHQFAGPYALDALEDEERRWFETHLEECEPCRREVAEFAETTAIIASIEEATPPRALRDRVLTDISQTRQLPPILPDKVIDLAEQRRRRAPRRRVLAAVAAALVAAVGYLGVGALSTDDQPDEFAQLLDAPDAVVTNLDGEAGTLQVVWSAEQDQAAVLGTDLADPDEGQAYALWFLLDDGVALAGVFLPEDGQVRSLLDFDDVATPATTGWAVTIEPESAPEQPTGSVVLAGTI